MLVFDILFEMLASLVVGFFFSWEVTLLMLSIFPVMIIAGGCLEKMKTRQCVDRPSDLRHCAPP